MGRYGQEGGRGKGDAPEKLIWRRVQDPPSDRILQIPPVIGTSLGPASTRQDRLQSDPNRYTKIERLRQDARAN